MSGPNETVKIALWLHDRYCSCNATPTDTRDGETLGGHLRRTGWIADAVDLLALTRQVDQ